MSKKIAVLITTYGEVEEPTLKNLFPNSRLILQRITATIANISKPLEFFIAAVRSVNRKKLWTKTGYRSQLNAINERQAKAIAAELKTLAPEDVSFDVLPAYYFIPPLIEDMLEKVKGYDGVIIAPMIPVESAFACGIACNVVLKQWGDTAFATTRVLHGLWNDVALVKMFANHVFENLGEASSLKKGLILAVHGTLTKDTKGNPPQTHTGLRETHAFYENLRDVILADARNPFASIKLGALNHTYGGTWMPETFELALEELKHEGVEEVSAFAYGFFADNSESDFEAVSLLNAAPFAKKTYIPCINDAPEFSKWMAAKILSSTKLMTGDMVEIPREQPAETLNG
ncbi:MAG: ferrochelatase [Rhizobacter sp.]|nr:ferrochelatase [Chlorobiales bacterium]